MKFGAVPVADAEGGVAVHSIRQGGLVLKKGTLIGKDEIAALKAAGIAVADTPSTIGETLIKML